MRVHGPLRVFGGLGWPESREPVQCGRYMVLDRLVVVVRVCWLCVVPRRCRVRW